MIQASREARSWKKKRKEKSVPTRYADMSEEHWI